MSTIANAAVEREMERSLPLWALPLTVVVIYPGLMLCFDMAINGYLESRSLLMAMGAMLAMLVAASISVLATRALMIMRHDTGPVLARGFLCLMFATPSLFSMTLTLARLAGVRQLPGLIVIWVSMWLAVGLLLYFKNGRTAPTVQGGEITRLRIVHGVTALCLLCGFLLAHLANHGLAIWSVELHAATMDSLRLWYRSQWVEPVLLTLMMVMIGTGVPMARQYLRQRMDAFRVMQIVTGVYVGVFICSHVIATLNGRRTGVETDWFFAAGPNGSLVDGGNLRGRLIPHYMLGTFALILHVACGLRIVLLKHDATKVFGNAVVYAMASVGVVVTLVIAAALLGFHVRGD